MKLRILSSAVLCALAAPGAFAALSPADAADVAAIQGTEREIILTGASAIQNNLLNGLTSICGSLVRMDNSGNIRAYLCRNAAATTTFPGQNLLIHHNVSGGSLNSVLATNINAGSPERQSIIANFSTCAASGSNYTGCGTGAGQLVSAQSMGGASDVDPIAFADSNVYTPGPTYPVSVSPASGAQVFAVVANTILYRKMQFQQGVTNDLGPVLPASCYDGTNATGTVENPAGDIAGDDFSPACQPSISREAYASIADGPASALKNGWAALLGAGITGPGNNVVKLCRRVATSGTQASSNIFFLANPSSEVGKIAPAGGFTTVAGANGSVIGSSKLWWWANSGTGDVLDCLGNANNGTGPDGTAASIPAGVGGALSVGSHYALGVVSAENDWRTQTAPLRTNWRFLKIDGESPEATAAHSTARDPFGRVIDSASRDQCARETYADGRYPFGYEFVIVRRTNLTAAQSGFIGEILGDGLFNPLSAAAVQPSANCNLISDNPPRGIVAKPSTAAGVNHVANPTRVAKGSSNGKPYQPIVFGNQGAEN